MKVKIQGIFTVTCAIVAVGITVESAFGRAFTWRNPFPSGVFEQVSNWQASGITPGRPQAGDDAIFDSDSDDTFEVTSSTTPEVSTTSVQDGKFEFVGSRYLGDLAVGDPSSMDLADVILTGGDFQADEVNISNTGTVNLLDGTFSAETINDDGTFNFAGGELSVDMYNGNLANNGGTLAPGSSPGITAISGGYTQSATSTLEIEIGGLIPGTDYDQVQVGGNATLDGTLVVTTLSGFQPQLGDVFEIIEVDGALIGQFLGVGEGAVVGMFGGISLALSYAGGDGNDVVLFAGSVPVPEPATWALMLVVTGTLWSTRRRRTAVG